MTSSEDPEQRIADLEKQVADARRIADLERQLAEARSQQRAPQQQSPQQQPPQQWQQPFDARAADFLAAFRNLPDGFGRSFGLNLGHASGPVDTRLADAPRHVPAGFVLAELLQFKWWHAFAMFLVAVPPIIVWITNPALLLPAAIVTLVAVYGYRLWTARKRLALLRWGRVAQLLGSEISSRATYFGGTTWSNVILPQAHGWKVTRDLWSGPSTTTKVRYGLDGYQGELTVRGRSYDDGVILADGRRPERAACVSSFAYDLDRDETGNWVGRLRPRLVVGMVVWVLFVAAWVAVPVAISTGYLGRLLAVDHTIRLEPGATRTLTDSGPQVVECNDGHLVIGGGSTPVTVHGHCASVTVSGIKAEVTVDSADSITANGIGNHVTYHSGTPRIVTGGIGDVVVRK